MSLVTASGAKGSATILSISGKQFLPEDVAYEIFNGVTTIDLTAEQQLRVRVPNIVYPRQREVLALHWHPEFIPLPLIEERVDKLFPSAPPENRLIIPTQHNELVAWGDFSGVEVDCYDPDLSEKVQLLCHFSNRRLNSSADAFRRMLSFTFQYRVSQLQQFIDFVLDGRFSEQRDLAAHHSGASPEIIEGAAHYVGLLKGFLDGHGAQVPTALIRNKLVRDYVNGMRPHYPEHEIDLMQSYLKELKELVKKQFSLKFFFSVHEVIEEARKIEGCITVPHPELFWPVMMQIQQGKYNVDAVEVWNPQSRKYTEFLVGAVQGANEQLRRGDRPILITCGDDCHFGEKILDPLTQACNPKAQREIGVQPAWDDPAIGKALARIGVGGRASVIRDYRNRLVA